MALQTR